MVTLGTGKPIANRATIGRQRERKCLPGLAWQIAVVLVRAVVLAEKRRHFDALARICRRLRCRPGDLRKYVDDEALPR